MKIDIEKTEKKGTFKWGDFIVLAVLIVAVALSLWLAFKPSKVGAVVEIYKKGRLVQSVSLYENREIVIDEDGRNVIKIEGGKVFMKESDCAGGDCVHSQPISVDGGSIICLPNEVVVRIVSSDVDAIT